MSDKEPITDFGSDEEQEQAIEDLKL